MSKDVSYLVANPTGNITILVETPVPVADQPVLAAQLMEREPLAEQVGFLSEGKDSDIALRMAGGEFCGNATMSAAAWFAKQSGRQDGRVTVSVSGALQPVSVELEPAPDGSYRGTVEMPCPRAVSKRQFSGEEYPVVSFDGIAHVILEGKAPVNGADKTRAEMLAKEWCHEMEEEAIGLMFYDREASRLTPLVYVPAAETICWENSCGSGTTAVGAYVASEEAAPVHLSLLQPGGTLDISAGPNGPFSMSGTVTLPKNTKKIPQ